MAKKPMEWLVKIKKNLPLLGICATVVSLSYWFLFSHYRNFSFVGGNDVIYKIESKLLDLRFKNRGELPSNPKVGILAIDEKSINQFERFPFSRRYYERAFANLKDLGVAWIGFDAIFSEPERTYLSDAKPLLRQINRQAKKPRPSSRSVRDSLSKIASILKDSPGDRSFQRGIMNFENIVLGYFFFGQKWEADINLGDRPRFPRMDVMESSAVQLIDMPEGKTLDDYPFLKKAHGLVANTPLISEASEHFAFFSNDADDDAINRWVVLVANIEGNLMPSLALKTIAEAENREIMVFFDDIGIESVLLVNRDNEEDVVEVPIDPLGTGRILVNHVGSGRTFHHYSLADAYNNSFTEEEKEGLRDAVLLLGATATGTNDIRPNPFDPSIDGVENHAAVIDNIMSRHFLRRPIDIYSIELMIVLGVGLLFSPFIIYFGAVISGIAVISFLAGYYFFDKEFWFAQGTWAYMAIPCMEITALYISTTLYKYMTEEREKKKVKGAFQHYLSPEVIDQVLDDPDSLSLGGEKKELTVFFSDVRSFTTISESLTPEKLCELMNDYFTPMTGIILKSNGVLDKYIGDAIMAFWGAPLHIPDHADRAAEASIRMLYALDVIREEFPQKGFPVIDIGIGLNTGQMSVGNMGSGDRFCYTVMGDSVNLGARLEGLTKEYGIKIMISEFTYRALTPGRFLTRDLDDIRVKGKNEPVKVYDLMRPDFLGSESDIREFIAAFESGRSNYRKQNWEQAKKDFLHCAQMKPDDKASSVFLERIDIFEAQPPGEEWDGVLTFKHK